MNAPAVGGLSFAPFPGWATGRQFPIAYAMGYFLTPLRGLAAALHRQVGALHQQGDDHA